MLGAAFPGTSRGQFLSRRVLFHPESCPQEKLASEQAITDCQWQKMSRFKRFSRF